MKVCEYSECEYHPAGHPRLKRYGNRCTLHGACAFDNVDVRKVLQSPVGASDLQSLTIGEIKYCIFNEKRKSCLDKLRSELKRREKAAAKGEQASGI